MEIAPACFNYLRTNAYSPQFSKMCVHRTVYALKFCILGVHEVRSVWVLITHVSQYALKHLVYCSQWIQLAITFYIASITNDN